MSDSSITELLERLSGAVFECRSAADLFAMTASFFEYLPHPAWIKAVGEDGLLYMVHANIAHERVTGISQSAYAAQRDRTVWGASAADQFEFNDGIVLVTGQALRTAEFAPDKDGVERLWRGWKWPLMQSGKVVAVCGVADAVEAAQ